MYKKPNNKQTRSPPKNNVGVVNLFDFDIIQSWKKIPICGICNQEYSVNVRKIRLPMNLDCFHNVCEKCIFQNRQNHIICPECNKKTLFSRPIREKNEYNYNLIGIISYIENQMQYDISHDSSKIRDNSMNNYNGQYECVECNKEYTNQICIQCNVPYCKNCFQNVHRYGKALQKHTYTIISSEKMNYLSNEKFHKKCFKHKRYIDQYCADCNRTICLICIPENHTGHNVSCIPVENQKCLAKAYCLMETLNIVKNQNQNAQKKTKYVQNKYKEHASDVIEQISNYFIELHTILQDIERKILMELRNKAMTPLQKAATAYAMFDSTQSTLDEMQNTLQSLVLEKPNHVPLSKVMENVNEILRQIPCRANFNNYEDNPFKFHINFENPENEIKKFFTLQTKSNTFNSKISTYFGENAFDDYDNQNQQSFRAIDDDKSFYNLNVTDILRSGHSFNLSYNNNINKNTSKNGSNNNQKQQQQQNNTIKKSKKNNYDTKSVLTSSQLSLTSSFMGAIGLNPHTQKGFISHIINPEEFYVQTEIFKKSYEKFKESCEDESSYAVTPDYIDIDSIYLIYNTTDKLWYRAQVIEPSEIHTDTYKVLLIDFGNTLEVPKQRFREISNELKTFKPAMKCSLYGVKPVNEKWTEEAKFIMHDIVSKEIVNLLILKEGDPYLVDIITTHNKYPTSVRDALLFTNVAEEIEISDELIHHSASASEGIKQSLICLSNMPKFFKYSFKEGENFRVKILNIMNPQQFYAAKYEHLSDIDRLQNDLNKEYENRQEKIYCPQLEMPCAVYINGIWNRAKVNKILGKGKCRVWLVDQGNFETVYWKQLRILNDTYLMSNEYAFQCSLIDIEPLQENHYTWTDKAIEEFKRIIKNPNIQLFIHRSKEFRYKVVLHIIKTQSDINVNALLVKYGHAISTGNESTQIDYEKTSIIATPTFQNSVKILKRQSTNNSINSINNKIQTKNLNNSLVKRKIKFTHIISPGEFYIQLIDHMPAITKLHEEIQLEQRKINTTEDIVIDLTKKEQKRKWKLNENCLVQTKLRVESSLQWYRGVIVEIECNENNDNNSDVDDDDDDDKDNSEDLYTIFLRDYGMKIHNIPSQRIKKISNLFNYACNGAIKCHMACVQPTGGLDTWSSSSIDELKNTIDKYESLAATLQGKRKNNSLPIILWGLRTELSDPLLPTKFKWININKVFVSCGLAHLIEKFNTKITATTTTDTEDDELTIENEIIEDKQKSMPDWLNNFMKGKIDDINEIIDKNETNSIFNDIDTELEETEKLINTEIKTIKSNEENEIIIESGIKNIENWRPSQIIEKTLFTAYPTYVDNNAIIYLHEAQKEIFLNKIRDTINKNISQLKQPENDYKWKIGQPCLAKYHLDNKFYRAIIKKIISSSSSLLSITNDDQDNEKNDIVEVEFIDYGNIEKCSLNDLRNDIMFATIPILATKFQLDRIKSINSNNNWTTEQLDFIHSKIVGKLCTIRVSSNQNDKLIKKCSIRFENYDLADLLVHENYAEYTKKIKENNDDDDVNDNDSDIMKNENDKENEVQNEKKEEQEEIDDGDNYHNSTFSLPCKNENDKDDNDDDDDDDGDNYDIEREVRRFKNKDCEKRFMDNEDYKKLFEKLEYQKLHNYIVDSDSDNDNSNNKRNNNNEDDDDDDDNDYVELESTYKSDYWKLNNDNEFEKEQKNDDNDVDDNTVNEIQESDNEDGAKALNDIKFGDFNDIDIDDKTSLTSFNPKSTSSVKEYNGMNKFTYIKLEQNLKGFYCQVTFIHSSTTLFVTPFINNVQNIYDIMFKKLQSIASSLPQLTKININLPCLALYSGDNLWYRALIRKYYPQIKKVDVIYVDFLNAELVSIKHIKKLPNKFLNFPLRNIQIQLYDVRPNPRYREHDIKIELSKLINERKLFVKIIKYIDDKIPEVILYRSENGDKVFYDKLITEKFYLKN